jgi:hypothetical protein
MKVSKIIEALKTLDPDDEIMIAWWERELVSEWFFDQDKLISKEKWNDAVEYFDSWDLQDTADEITEMVGEVLAKGKENE